MTNIPFLGSVYTLPSLEVLEAVTQERCHINDEVYLEKPGKRLLSQGYVAHPCKNRQENLKQTDLSFWSYWSICRVCVPVRYPLCSVWFSGQWVVSLRSHRSVAGWCPGRFLCNLTKERETDVNVAWKPVSVHTQRIHFSRHTLNIKN